MMPQIFLNLEQACEQFCCGSQFYLIKLHSYEERSCWDEVCSRNRMNMKLQLAKMRFRVGEMRQHSFNGDGAPGCF